MSFFRQVKEFCGDAAKAFRRNIKRYGVAAATLFSTTGAYNGYPMNDNASYKAALNSKQISLPDITPDQSAGLTASFTQAAEENKSYPDYELTDFGFINPLLEQTLINAMTQQDSPAAEENVVTLADLSYTDIEFTAEDLAAMVPSPTAIKLAENAEDVAARMNCEGYCFRGAKKLSAKPDWAKCTAEALIWPSGNLTPIRILSASKAMSAITPWFPMAGSAFMDAAPRIRTDTSASSAATKTVPARSVGR